MEKKVKKLVLQNKILGIPKKIFKNNKNKTTGVIVGMYDRGSGQFKFSHSLLSSYALYFQFSKQC
jgi:hypothetical protein